MQGRKRYTPQLFYQTSLERLVPQDNFYRILLQELDLHFLYKSTKRYYGREGQESIDPVVFFKVLNVLALSSMKKSINTNVSKRVAIKQFCPSKASEPTAKVTKRKRTGVARATVNIVHYGSNAVAR